MALSAFKSTSKRGNLPTSSTNTSSGKESAENSTNKVPLRRSRSVSAVSRTQLDVASDFLNKRENPLFWSSGSPPSDEVEPKTAVGAAKFAVSASTSKVASTGVVDRGRSVSRNSGVGNKVSGGRKEIGRSLSRVDTGRRGRSVSRGHHGNSESEVEQDCNLSTSYRSRSISTLASNSEKKANLVRSDSDLSDHMKSPRTWSSQHPTFEPSDGSAVSLSCSHIPNWEDGISTCSFSEAEEKTIKAVCEQMKGNHLDGDTATSGIYETVRSEVRRAISDIQNDLESAIRRNNATTIATTSVADLPPDLVNPGAVELVLDIRREYAIKLEESQERARKLRADLAVEEHRGLELSRILKEILPDPKNSSVQKSRPGRKTSIERRKMSKRLTEEAMAYFDECVSISTFDSSDFSAPEDPPLSLVGASTVVGDGASLPQGGPSISISYSPNSHLNHKQESGSQGQLTHSHEDSGETANSSNEPPIDQAHLKGANTEWGRKFQFSFAHKPTETVGLQHDIRNYIKKFEKDGDDSQIVRSNYYDVDEYNLQAPAQSLLFDRVFFKNGIESGNLLLCGGGIAISFSPFASVI